MKIALIILGVFIAYHLVKFFIYYKKNTGTDAKILSEKTLQEVLSILIQELNQYAYNGQGTVTNLSHDSLKLYKQDSPQVILFSLLGGVVSLEWRLKVMGREFIFTMGLNNIQEITDDGQRKTAQSIIRMFEDDLERFKERM